jgi:predicted  nucleic acid-binding Zn-ribbon protein
MPSDRRFDEANRAAREHIERTRERLRDGRLTLERLHAEIDDTNRHIETMASWIEENERALAEERNRRPDPNADAPA